jgi:hypothetical protein
MKRPVTSAGRDLVHELRQDVELADAQLELARIKRDSTAETVWWSRKDAAEHALKTVERYIVAVEWEARETPVLVAA